MFGSAVLETAIGAVFVFLLVSLVGSGVSNWISETLQLRADHLEKNIRDMLLNGDPQLLNKLYDSPLIKALHLPYSGTWDFLIRLLHLPQPGKKPIDIPTQTFILALFDAFVPGASGKTNVQEIHDHIVLTLKDESPLKTPLLAFFNKAETKIEDARKSAENWFNGAEEWMTKTYREKIQLITFIVSLGVGIFFNVDTVAVASNLWKDPTLRSSVTAAATKYSEQSATTTDQTSQANARKAIDELNKLNLPIGWQLTFSPTFSAVPSDWTQSNQPVTAGNYLLKILGWLITGFAGAQGAPFWFDLLRKLTQKSE